MTADLDDLPAEGAVLTFGRSRFAENQASQFWIKHDRIVACSCGDEHTAVIAESHRVFTFGANEFGQLGLGHTRAVTRPSCVRALKSEQCTLVGCGKSHTVVGTANGRLFAFGLNQDGQLGLGHTESTLAEVTAWTGRAVQLEAGVAHTAALTGDGRLFTWGSNAEGQCGLGDSPGACVPTLLPSDEEIVNVSCGYRHTAFVTAAGELFTFGENDEGQLGLGDREDRSRPTLVRGLSDVAKVACGGQHTLLLLESGQVWCFGSGSQGQLGLGSRLVIVLTPHQLTLGEVRAKDVATGHCHSAIITDDNRLLTFGDSRHGKLCAGEEESNVFVPQLAVPADQLLIDKAFLGGCQSMVLVDRLTSPRMLENLPPVTNGSHSSDDVNNAARRRRRDKEVSLPPLGRSLPALKDAPRPPPAPALHEDHIEPELAPRQVGAACELQSVSSLMELQPRESARADDDVKDEVQDDDQTKAGNRKEGTISRFFSRFIKRKSATPVKEEPPKQDNEEDPSTENHEGEVPETVDTDDEADTGEHGDPPEPAAEPEQPTPDPDPAATREAVEDAHHHTKADKDKKKRKKMHSKTCVVV